jgi:hypothetical protein
LTRSPFESTASIALRRRGGRRRVRHEHVLLDEEVARGIAVGGGRSGEDERACDGHDEEPAHAAQCCTAMTRIAG